VRKLHRQGAGTFRSPDHDLVPPTGPRKTGTTSCRSGTQQQDASGHRLVCTIL
jgi:hypothetical protein